MGSFVRLISEMRKWGEVLREEKLQIEQLYEAYHRDVYHFALYYTNNKQEAEDITQETFLKVLKQLNRSKDKSKVKTWIVSIARNTAVDIHRRQKVRKLLSEKFRHYFNRNVINHRSRQMAGGTAVWGNSRAIDAAFTNRLYVLRFSIIAAYS